MQVTITRAGARQRIILLDNNGRIAGIAITVKNLLRGVRIREDVRGRGFDRTLLMAAAALGANTAAAVSTEMKNLLASLGWSSNGDRRWTRAAA